MVLQWPGAPNNYNYCPNAYPIYCFKVDKYECGMCVSACVCLCWQERDDPWGEQIDGIMYVLNIITMQNLDGILGGSQALMGLGSGSSI